MVLHNSHLLVDIVLDNSALCTQGFSLRFVFSIRQFECAVFAEPESRQNWRGSSASAGARCPGMPARACGRGEPIINVRKSLTWAACCL